MLCYVMLCYVMLTCYVMLCYVMYHELLGRDIVLEADKSQRKQSIGISACQCVYACVLRWKNGVSIMKN